MQSALCCKSLQESSVAHHHQQRIQEAWQHPPMEYLARPGTLITLISMRKLKMEIWNTVLSITYFTYPIQYIYHVAFFSWDFYSYFYLYPFRYTGWFILIAHFVITWSLAFVNMATISKYALAIHFNINFKKHCNPYILPFKF